MRILHTADWHLGHTLREHARVAEHRHFLDWLVEKIAERDVDAVLLAGDVFDSANPPPVAWRLWFDFLGALHARRPATQVVVIAGNHDAPARLEAPRELLAAFGVRVVGRIVRAPGGGLRTDDLLVPLSGADGSRALCVAIPFLRASDVLGLVPDAPAEDPLIGGMRALHAELFAAARAVRRDPDQAMIALAHGYLVGGAISELSERKVLGGNQHALPLDLFPDDCAYVALGHLHRPQALAGRNHVRYCGSPLPLSMPERLHAHHVVFADFDGGRLDKVWSLRTPRLIELLRIPDRGALDPDAALAAVEALPPRDPVVPDELRPFVEVAVQVDGPAPQLAERIARALESRNARLVRIDVATRRPPPGSAATLPRRELTALVPEEVFVRRYARDHEGPVPEPLLRAFRALCEQVEHEGTA